MDIELIGAIAIGALTAVVSWFLRRCAWKLAYWTGASLILVLTVTFISILIWTLTGGGRRGEFFETGYVLLALTCGITVVTSLIAALVGAAQSRSVKHSFIQIVVSGYLDSVLGATLSYIFLPSIFDISTPFLAFTAVASWLIALAWIYIATRTVSVNAE